jgi:hypothetical protein
MLFSGENPQPCGSAGVIRKLTIQLPGILPEASKKKWVCV